MMPAVSFSSELSKIKTGLHWWSDPKANDMAAAIHGAKIGEYPVNEHGVFIGAERLEFKAKDGGFCNAELRFAETPKGHWLISYTYTIGWHSAGSMPSVWDEVGFATREEAIEAGINCLKRTCEDHKGPEHNHGGNPQAHRHAGRLLDLIEEYEIKQKQYTLFEV